MKFFICSYTNKVKDYASAEFFSNLYKLSNRSKVVICDNTIDGTYIERIETLTRSYENFDIQWVLVPKEPKINHFQRNVLESTNLLRDEFLKTDCTHFLIIESDVIPPLNLLDKLEEDILFLEGEKWGIIGGLYLKGFHDYSLTGVQRTHHVLSGCSLYNRDLIKETPFKLSPDTLGVFPDAMMSHDAVQLGYSLWNDHNLLCEHLEISPGNRGQSKL